MVYCGRPSKACHECRTRRTKCDTKTPSCSQCRRAGRNCWGYIDPTSSMFRSENWKFKNIQHDSSPSPLGPFIPSTRWISTPYFVPPPLSPSADEQATCFFFQNFVLEDACASRGHFEYLPGIYRNSKVNTVLQDAVLALGLAGLANRTRASRVMVKANLKYAAAVRAVSSVLSEMEEAKADQTLIAVMLLSLYETIASEAPRSLRSWTQHVKGATSILRLRGEAQLHTIVGRRLFVQLRSQVITTCIQRRLAVPSEIQDWSRISKQYESLEELSASALSEIAMALCALRSTMSDFIDHSNSLSVVSQALEIDASFSEWVANLPSRYFYNTVVMTKPCEQVFGDRYHIYGGICMATSWNSYRCLRIILNEILVEQMVHLCQLQLSSPSPNSELIAFYLTRTRAYQELVAQLTFDICASVPFYFSYHHRMDSTTQVQVPAMSGNLLLWCLYTAVVAGNVNEVMRFWIVARLRDVAETMGIRNASGLAEVLSERREITVWETEIGTDEGESDAGEWYVNTREIVLPEEL